jgi:hypothetical protein
VLKFAIPTMMSLRRKCAMSIVPGDVVKETKNANLQRPERYKITYTPSKDYEKAQTKLKKKKKNAKVMLFDCAFAISNF